MLKIGAVGGIISSSIGSVSPTFSAALGAEAGKSALNLDIGLAKAERMLLSFKRKFGDSISNAASSLPSIYLNPEK